MQIFCVLLFLFPADTVVKVFGALGFPAALFAMALFVTWLGSSVLGLHNPRPLRTPTRSVLTLFWLVSLVSYALMPWHPDLTSLQRGSALRWLELLAGMTGVALIAAETLNSVQKMIRVMRTIVWAATFCACVAVLQFWAGFSIVPYIRNVMIGFQLNGPAFLTQARGALLRVAGTTSHPIELGVVCAMLTPMAIWLAMTYRGDHPGRQWIPPLALAAAIASSISRAGVLSLAIAGAVFLVGLPARRRVVGLAVVPIALVGVFLTTPGFLSTFSHSTTAGSSDSSLTNRTNNYTFVADLVHQNPWLGTGGGTYLPANAIRIFDNEYLTVAVSLGLVGVAALILLFLIPPLSVLAARQRVDGADGRALGGALAGAGLAALIASATFDSLSFPVFAFTEALILGLSGAFVLRVRAAGRGTRVNLDDEILTLSG